MVDPEGVDEDRVAIRADSYSCGVTATLKVCIKLFSIDKSIHIAL